MTTSQGVSNLLIAPVVRKGDKKCAEEAASIGIRERRACLSYSPNAWRAELRMVWFESRIHSRQRLPCFASGRLGRRLVLTCFNSSLHVCPYVPSCWMRKSQFYNVFICPTSARCQTICSAWEQRLKGIVAPCGTRTSRLVSALQREAPPKRKHHPRMESLLWVICIPNQITKVPYTTAAATWQA